MEDFKVLLVDDEEDFLLSLSERLRLRDVAPDTASSGQAALDRIREAEPAVIVLDLKMPGMHGLEVLKRVKRAHPHIEIVILTGHGSDADRAEAERLGAFAYLQKPVSMDVLMGTLRKAFQHAKTVKHGLDTALMAAAMAQAGEVEEARRMMEEEERFQEEQREEQ
jgi:DNA-binding NtrC family response regulator